MPPHIHLPYITNLHSFAAAFLTVIKWPLKHPSGVWRHLISLLFCHFLIDCHIFATQSALPSIFLFSFYFSSPLLTLKYFYSYPFSPSWSCSFIKQTQMNTNHIALTYVNELQIYFKLSIVSELYTQIANFHLVSLAWISPKHCFSTSRRTKMYCLPPNLLFLLYSSLWIILGNAEMQNLPEHWFYWVVLKYSSISAFYSWLFTFKLICRCEFILCPYSQDIVLLIQTTLF